MRPDCWIRVPEIQYETGNTSARWIADWRNPMRLDGFWIPEAGEKLYWLAEAGGLLTLLPNEVYTSGAVVAVMPLS